MVLVRCKESGTHRGVGQLPVNGGLLVGVAPTQKHFEAEVAHLYTVRDGNIVDHGGVRYDLAMMQQLGLLAGPKPFDWAKFSAEANKPYSISETQSEHAKMLILTNLPELCLNAEPDKDPV